MQFIKSKSIQVLSDGSLFFFQSNNIKPTVTVFLEKDLKNFELNKKKELSHQKKSKYFSIHKNKYLT